MIETIMIFALGFLTAGLLALMILPAVHRRSERLAKRRLEALFPLSISELTADRDHLRAEFAVAARRLERRIDTLAREKAATLEEIGRRAFVVKSLEDDVAERKSAIAALERDNTRLNATLDETRAMLATTQATLAVTSETLATSQTALASLETTHEDALNDLDSRRIMIVELKTRVANLEDQLDETERTLNSRLVDLEAARSRGADQEFTIARDKTRIATLTDQLAATEDIRDDQVRRLETIHASEAELARKLAETTAIAARREATIAERDASIAALRAKGADLETLLAGAHEAARIEVLGLAEAMEILRAEKQSLDGALQHARADRTRLQREIVTLKHELERGTEQVRAENAALRTRIEDVAAEIVRLAAPPAVKQPRAKRPA